MKHFFTILLITIPYFGISQICYFSLPEYFDFLNVIDKGHSIYSLDSIRCNDVVCMKAIKKNDDFNITESLIRNNYGTISIPAEDSLFVKYHENEQIKSYLSYHEYYNIGMDTIDYLLFDSEGKLIQMQRRFDLWCGTGSPNDECRTINTYNDHDELITELHQLKWNYTCQTRPFDLWVNFYEIEYKYDDGKIISEFHRSNYFSEAEDTVRLELIPYLMIHYNYANEDLSEIKHEIWDLDIEQWKNNSLERYSYSGDTTFLETHQWKSSSLKWEKKFRKIIVWQNEHENIVDQKWDPNEQNWVNTSWKYYQLSEVEGYFDYFYDQWNKENQEWVFYSKMYFQYAGDTIVRTSEYASGSSYKNHYLYNESGNLLFHCQFNFKEGTWELRHETRNVYNTDDILLRYTNNYYPYGEASGAQVTDREYFWDKLVNTKNPVIRYDLNIIPNPVQNYLKIETSLDVKELRIFNSKGQLILVNKNTDIRVNDLAAGVYYVNLISKEGLQLIKQFIKL